MKFPDPITLPVDVACMRAQRQAELIRSARLGICIRLTIILFELWGVYLIHSSALLLDALSSLMDLFSTLFLIFCIKLAQRPPDRNHPFGHGRYEPMGGLFLGLIFTAIGGFTFFQQIGGALDREHTLLIHPFGWIFPAAAMVLLELSYRFIMRTAKRTHSPAIAADAVHYRIDGISSLFATLALLAAVYYPAWSYAIDHAGAALISLFMLLMGILAAKTNFHQLMDRIPDSQFFDLVKEAALLVEGVWGTEKIRIQLYGPDAHVDIDVEVDPALSVLEAHQISQLVRAEIQKKWPAVRDVTVHIEPYFPNDH